MGRWHRVAVTEGEWRNAGSTPPSRLRRDTSPFVLRKNGEDQPGSRVFPQAMGHVEKWTLKQVQGNGSYWFSGDELE